jgi:hypothetical protein
MADWTEESPTQFKVKYNQEDGSFKIIDLWHETIRNLPVDAEIPDDSPALKTLSSMEVNSLLGKLNEMGWIDKMFGKGNVSEGFTPSTPRKSLQEIAVEKISDIATSTGIANGVDPGVAKEAITGIREVVNRIL